MRLAGPVNGNLTLSTRTEGGPAGDSASVGRAYTASYALIILLAVPSWLDNLTMNLTMGCSPVEPEMVAHVVVAEGVVVVACDAVA